MTDLKPCPFCGGEADVMLSQSRWGQSYTIHHAEKGRCPAGFVASMQFATEAEAIAAWNARAELGSGTLTAEQVMAIAGKHQPDYCSDTHVCFDWQAIADELNEALGGGECDAILDESYCKGIHGYCEGLKCSNCGEPLFSEFKSCPWCGKRIRKKVGE